MTGRKRHENYLTVRVHRHGHRRAPAHAILLATRKLRVLAAEHFVQGVALVAERGGANLSKYVLSGTVRTVNPVRTVMHT